MAMHTVTTARTRLRRTRTGMASVDPVLAHNLTWPRYGNNLPNRYAHATDWGHRYRTTRGAVGSGR